MALQRFRILSSKSVLNLAALVVLVLASQIHPFTGSRFGSLAPPFLRALVNLASSRGLNVEDQTRQTAGYYEGLLQEGSRVSSIGSVITGRVDEESEWNASVTIDTDQKLRSNTPGSIRRNDGAKPIFTALRFHSDFLIYDFMPDSPCGPYDDKTNSWGMYDREYPKEKAPGVWRIAMLGDSLVRGLGTRLGESFEARLETWLNEARKPDGPITRYEVLNFGVDGYCITQAVDVAATVAAPFHPDVYVLG